MLSTVVLFISATLGFLCIASMHGENKSQDRSLINKYLSVIIAFQAFRFAVYGFLQAYAVQNTALLTNFLDVCVVALMPCFYLYFRDLVHEKGFEAGNLLHFIAPTLLVLIFLSKQLVFPETGTVVRKSFLVVSILLYALYAYFGFRLLAEKVWRRRSEINAVQMHNELIRNWTILLYAGFIAIVTIRITTGFLIHRDYHYDTHYLWMTALIWSALFVKILLTPEILYGYGFLSRTIETVTEKRVLDTVWKTDGPVTPIVSEKDRKTGERISPTLTALIHGIEELSFHSHAFRNPDLSLEDIAAALKVPLSHVSYIFKYHCRESFSDYKKIVRIHDATRLLESGYLNEKTIESLSQKVGFSSYVTFYLAFKSITGMPTQEYVKKSQFALRKGTG